MREQNFVQIVMVTWRTRKMALMPIHGESHLNLLLQNQKAHDLGTWYVA